jgi:hypothetical protein
MAAFGGGASMAPPISSAGSVSPAAPADSADGDSMQPAADAQTLTMDPDFDLSSTFDVPAFLRRQEG